jgi:uncharacterized protein (DUF983 family)
MPSPTAGKMPALPFKPARTARGGQPANGYTVFATPMPTRKTSSTLASMLGQRCPRCREGRIFHYSIFRGFPKMCERCSVCDLKFQREEGYFLGAMYISFGLALVIIALIAGLLWAITGWWITRVTIWAVILFLPLAPAISLLARVLWIYLDQAFDPEKT